MPSAAKIVDGTKRCSSCGAFKQLLSFNRNPQQSSGRAPRCRECQKRHDAKRRGTPEGRAKWLAQRKAYRRARPVIAMLADARKRAKRLGVPYSLTLADVEMPTLCPVFGVPMETGVGQRGDFSPSLDRIVPSLGYVRGNVRVMSALANTMKNKASLAQLREFADWVYRVTDQPA